MNKKSATYKIINIDPDNGIEREFFDLTDSEMITYLRSLKLDPKSFSVQLGRARTDFGTTIEHKSGRLHTIIRTV